MVKCSFFGCKNASKPPQKNKEVVSFFRFPTELPAIEEWVKLINMQRTPSTSSRVCSKHFHTHDTVLKQNGQCWLLPNRIPKPYAVPVADCPHQLREVAAQIACLEKQISKQTVQLTRNKAKLHSERQNVYRTLLRIKKLQQDITIWESKKFLTDEGLSTADKACQELIVRFKQTLAGKGLPREFPSSLRDFAVMLYRYSPAAYNYVRTKLNKCLPGPWTILRTVAERNAAAGTVKPVESSSATETEAAVNGIMCGTTATGAAKEVSSISLYDIVATSPEATIEMETNINFV